MAAKVKKKTPTKKAGTAPKKAASKKPAAKKKASPAKAPSVKGPSKKHVDLHDLDRKGLAARARLLKKELLAIRFNLQSPSLRDYRNKKKELATVLSRLGSN